MPDACSARPDPSALDPGRPPHASDPLPICQYWQIGRMPFEQARQLQERIALDIASCNFPATLLLLEHPHTFTLGRRGQDKNLLWDAATCQERGVSVYQTDRGGDITYHGPGQLVGYPLLALGKPMVQAVNDGVPRVNYVAYLRQLEEMLIQCLELCGVKAVRVGGKTGVWVQRGDQPEKLASIGVKVDARGITRHGFALNVAADMSYWQGIIPCGLAGDKMTSLAELLTSPPTMQQVCQAVITAFGNQFHYHMVKYPGGLNQASPG